MAQHLASEPGEAEQDDARLLSAIDLAAEKLGNTREVCRSSYLHPVIPQAFHDGTLMETWRRSRRGVWMDRAESTVNRLIAGYSTTESV